jgi:hypothetical protein
MDKVCGTSGAELARGAGGAGSVEADGDHVVEKDTGFLSCDPEAIRDLLQTNIRPLPGQSWMLEQALDQEPLLLVQQSVVDSGSA